MEEALRTVPAAEDITYVLVCGGVGSIASAVFLGFFTYYSQIQESYGGKTLNPPRFIVVELTEADCLCQSAKKGEMCLSEGSLRTSTAGLACRGLSPAAWKILYWLTSDFVTVPDEVAVEGMKKLAIGRGSDIPVVCEESSAANVGVMLQVANDESLRENWV